MLILRITPPRLLLLPRAAPAADDLTAFYFRRLWRCWRWRDRAIAAVIAAGGALANVRALAAGAGAWGYGWNSRAQAMVGDADPAAFLDMRARKGINRLLNPGAFPLDANPLKNKRLFACCCRESKLPIPQTFTGPPEALAAWIATQQAVLVKPNFSSKGRGIVRYAQEAGSWSMSAGRIDFDALQERLANAVKRGAILQQCVATHPELAPISPGALPSLRIMTCLNEAGVPEACGVVLRLSAGGDRPIDNFQAGNLAATIDSSGECGSAFQRRGNAIEVLAVHPRTGAAILSRPVPDLQGALDLAVAAHRAFEGFTVIGWDVGIGATGPVLIEGNWNPGTDVLQMVGGKGIGATRLGQLYRHHLERVPAERWRSARPYEVEPRRHRH